MLLHEWRILLGAAFLEGEEDIHWGRMSESLRWDIIKFWADLHSWIARVRACPSQWILMLSLGKSKDFFLVLVLEGPGYVMETANLYKLTTERKN